MIHIDKLYDLMATKGFQEPRTGNLFFPAYIYTYPPDHEYAIREQLAMLNEKLSRPSHYLDCMMVNIYHELLDYLQEVAFAGRTLFELVMEKEQEDPGEAITWIREEINQGDFYPRFENKVRSHFSSEKQKRVYLILYGFGSVYPYLRASEFLKRTEKLIKEFKVVVFYPGTYTDGKYNLFGMLDDDHMYRANNLNILLGEEK